MWNRLADQISRELSRETGLSEADFDILMGLLEAEGQPIRAIALRCGLEWEKSRLSHQLRRMEQRGLVRREVCLEDNRGAVIVLTETGKHLATKARQVHDETLQQHLFDVISLGQIDALGDIADTVLARLEVRHIP
jgi:DNA-binding MarR family transcriptional regulator